jgi:putative transposase
MARLARLARLARVNQPYHVTHRGNQRGPVFFTDEDRAAYLADLARCAAQAGLDIWGYCLMSNHIHLLAVPRRPDSLARGMGRAQQRHARRVNAAQGWLGHLRANRFYSTPLDEAHLWTAIKYIELNPVRAGVVARAEDYRWSSARAHSGRAGAGGRVGATGGASADRAAGGDGDVEPRTEGAPEPSAERPEGAPELFAPDRPFGGARPHPVTGRPIGWAARLALGVSEEEVARLREATSTGRPCGSEAFVAALERELDRPLTPARRGRKPREGSGSLPLDAPDLFDPG